MKIIRAAVMVLFYSGAGFAQQRTAPKKPDVCALITKADVEAGLQQSVAKGPTPGGMGPMATCEFEIGSGPVKGQWNLQLMACSAAGFKTLVGASAQAIANIGDEAAWDGRSLTVRKGRQCLFVPGWSGSGSLDIAKTLGSKAVARMSK